MKLESAGSPKAVEVSKQLESVNNDLEAMLKQASQEEKKRVSDIMDKATCS